MTLRDRLTDAGGGVTSLGAAARESLGERLPSVPDIGRVQTWLAEAPMPEAPATDTWTLSVGSLLSRLGNVPAAASKSLGVLDRFGRVSVGPDRLGIDGDDFLWSEVTAVRTAPVATVLSQDVVSRELERVKHLLVPFPGRGAVLAHVEAVLGVLLARALASESRDVVYAVQSRGGRGRERTVTVGLAAALALIALPRLDRSIRATAERHGIPATGQRPGQVEDEPEHADARRDADTAPAETRSTPPSALEAATVTTWNLASSGESRLLRPGRPPGNLTMPQLATSTPTVPASHEATTLEQPTPPTLSAVPAAARPTSGPAVPAAAARRRTAPLGFYGGTAVGCFAVAAVAAVAIAIGASSDDVSRSATSQDGDSAPLPPPLEDSPQSDPGPESTAPTQPEVATGDLGLSVPMAAPVCDSSWVVFLGAAIDPAAYASDVQVLLAGNPGADYTLTQGGCSSMRQALPDGTLIYAVWTGPYPDQASACAARVGLGDTAYVKRMDNSTPADQLWEC